MDQRDAGNMNHADGFGPAGPGPAGSSNHRMVCRLIDSAMKENP